MAVHAKNTTVLPRLLAAQLVLAVRNGSQRALQSAKRGLSLNSAKRFLFLKSEDIRSTAI